MQSLRIPLFFTLIFLFMGISLSGQSIPIQLMVVDQDGFEKVNTPVKLRLTMRNDTLSTTGQYVEVHTTTTNDLGIVSIQFGEGIPTSNTKVLGLDGFTFSQSEPYIRTELDTTISPSSYISLGWMKYSYPVVAQRALKADTADYIRNFNPYQPPQVITLNVDQTDSTLVLSGLINFTGGDNNTSRGFYWGTNPSPIASDNVVLDSLTGMGVFTYDLFSQIEPNTTYYVRAFAENQVVKSYGDVVQFTRSYGNPNGAYINNRGCVVCDNYAVGDTFSVNNIRYTVADKNMILESYSEGRSLNRFCTSKITDMTQMFLGATTFNKDIGNWDVSNVIYMGGMFEAAASFNQDIGNWDVSSVQNMEDMFRGATSFNQDIGNWDVSNVIYMGYMFNQAANFNQDVGDWDVSNVLSVAYMFQEANSFNQDLRGWCVSQFSSYPNNFSHNSALTLSNHPVWGTCP